jgi:hypothetical protein
MHKPTIALLTAALPIALTAAGCGSSDNTESTATTAALTKAVFVKQANAICATGNKATGKAIATITKNTPEGQSITIVKTAFVPAVQAQITAIRHLGAPEGDEQTVSQMLDLAQADLNAIKQNPKLVFSEKDQFADFAKIAHPYGLTECDSGNS